MSSPTPIPVSGTRADGAFRKLARLQTAHPVLFVAIVLGLSAVAGVFALRLELRLRFEHLLPEARPSVVELARLNENVRAGSHVFVLVEGGSGTAQRSFGDGLVDRIRAKAPPWLSDVADGVQEAREFLTPRAALFAQLSDLEQLRDEVEARWSWEVANQTGTNLDDEPPPELSWEKLQKRFGLPSSEQFPGGYYQAKNETALVVAVNTTINAGDLQAMEQALALVKTEAEQVRSTHPELRLSYAGDLVTGLAEYGAVTKDLMSVGLLGVGMIVAILFIYFWRLRALLALSIALASGLALTFGLTQLLIGHLNVATGFQVSIVAGNGINFGIIFLARFFEERRRGLEPGLALEVAHSRTWLGTLAAALAAAAAYGSLGISEFRAFRDFALIGSLGMVACWLVSYLLLPPVLLLIERLRPMVSKSARMKLHSIPPRIQGVSYGGPLARVVALAPRWVAIGGSGLAVAGALALVPYLRSDPMEYNMRQMQNDLGDSAEMYRASRITADIMGAKLDSAMVLLADRPEQVPELKRMLEERRDRASQQLKPFEAVHTAFDFVPHAQAEKLPILLQISSRLKKAHARGFVTETDYAKLEPFLPPETLKPWRLEDLPAVVARPFTDRAGVIGRLALIEPTAGQSDSDVKYLLRWADSFRSVVLPNGEIVRGSGRAVIFADILSTVLGDIPRTVLVSFFMTVATVLLAFRRGFDSLLVIGSLLVGLGWVVLAMAVFDLKINFFNFVALPVSFGIGVDYAVNLVQRYSEEPERGVLGALRSTGGAVILCSLTTILGYLALLASVNQAIRSLGTLAVLGEIGCLLAATLVLPAFLLLRERQKALADSGKGKGVLAADAAVP